jgi:uncharacterized membrane protein
VVDGTEGDAEATAAEDSTPGVDRLLTLSDGVVAIALTLLVLQLVVPSAQGISTATARSPHYLWSQLTNNGGDQFIAYVISFYIIAQFWLAHHRVFRSIHGHVEGLAWWNFAFLFTITLMPFSSDLLGRFGQNPVAIDVFAVNLLLASLTTQGVAFFARRHGLQKGVMDPHMVRSGFFRSCWACTVVVVTGSLAWVFPTLAVFGWLLFLPAQRVSEALATRFPGSSPAAAPPAWPPAAAPPS